VQLVDNQRLTAQPKWQKWQCQWQGAVKHRKRLRIIQSCFLVSLCFFTLVQPKETLSGNAKDKGRVSEINVDCKLNGKQSSYEIKRI